MHKTNIQMEKQTDRSHYITLWLDKYQDIHIDHMWSVRTHTSHMVYVECTCHGIVLPGAPEWRCILDWGWCNICDRHALLCAIVFVIYGALTTGLAFILLLYGQGSHFAVMRKFSNISLLYPNSNLQFSPPAYCWDLDEIC